jgi:hypothetical protein
LEWRVGRSEGQQRVLAGHVEDREVGTAGSEPRGEVRTADSRTGGTTGFDNKGCVCCRRIRPSRLTAIQSPSRDRPDRL